MKKPGWIGNRERETERDEKVVHPTSFFFWMGGGGYIHEMTLREIEMKSNAFG